jgi:quercetin dioxygenase-like cupin family protein
MTGLKYTELPVEQIRKGVERRVVHTDHLMMVLFDFNDGPQEQPDPPHSHPHEQISFVAEGEIIFFLEGQPFRLGAGDVFLVPSGKPHTIQLLSKMARLIDCFTPLREEFLLKK